MPERIRMHRDRPWRRDHPDAVIVDRSTKWGNPFRVYRCDCCGHWDVIDDNGVTYHVDHAVARGDASPTGIILDPGPTPPVAVQRREAIAHAVELFEQDLEWGMKAGEIRAELAGKDLACWCPLPDPGQQDYCHARVLIDIANESLPLAQAREGA